MSSAEVSWAQLHSQVDVNGPKSQGHGKRSEVKEMTNEKGEIVTDLTRPAKENLIPKGPKVKGS